MRYKIKKVFKEKISFIQALIFGLIKNVFYDLFENDLAKTISKNMTIVSVWDTLDEIETTLLANQKGMYLRFGDGDVFLMKGKSDSYQIKDRLLSKEMQETFLISGSNVFKCLAIHSDLFGFAEKMSIGNHKNPDSSALKLFADSYKYFVGCKIYSPVALHYISIDNPLRANLFLKTLKTFTKIFVGNQSTDSEIVDLIFGKKAVHVKTPPRNAYLEIDRIENETVELINKTDGFFVICIAMGCSGRPFMKRIWERNFNVFLFDFGSLLDGISGNDSRTWLKINNINYDLLLNGLDEIE